MPSQSNSPSNRENKKKSNSRDKKQQKNGSGRSDSSSSSSSSRSSKQKSKGSVKRRSNSRQDRAKPYSSNYQRREEEAIAPTTRLFVTNIDSKFSTDELNKDLKALFEPFGSIKDVNIKTKQGSRNSYVFIDFDTVENATKALTELKGQQFKGKPLKVEYGRGERKTEDRRSDKCYICHKEGHFAKDCKYNRFTVPSDDRREGRNDDRFDRSRDNRSGRDYDRDDRRDRDRDRDGGRDRDRDRDHHRSRRYDSHSNSSSSSRSVKKRHHDRGDRDDYRRRDRDYRRQTDKKRDYPSRRN